MMRTTRGSEGWYVDLGESLKERKLFRSFEAAHIRVERESLCVAEITLGGMEFLSKLTDM